MHKVTVGERLFDVDICVPGQRLIIEFDGAHWHENKAESDKSKSEQLRGDGWTVVRVREEPLEQLSKWNVLVPYVEEPHILATTVLQHLESVCGIEIPRMDERLAADGPLCADQAEQYIRKLLHEKGESSDVEVLSPAEARAERRDARWRTTYALAKQFASREGHAIVPAKQFEDGYHLGRWVSQQRVDHRSGVLWAEHRAALEDLPGWSWDPYGDGRERGFATLLQFVQREGHALVTQRHKEDEFPLGTWVARQRARYRKGILPQPEIEQLESLPGWAWSTPSGRKPQKR